MITLRDALRAFDFEAWARDKLDSVPVRGKPGEIRVNCWRCGDTRRRMSINVREWLWNCYNEHCWRQNGGLLALMSEVEGVDEQTISRRLMVAAGAHATADEEEWRKRLLEGFDTSMRLDRAASSPAIEGLPAGLVPLENDVRAATQVRTYLSLRGVRLDELPEKVWATGLHPISGQPTFCGWMVWDTSGQGRGPWQARRTDDGKPKYLGGPHLGTSLAWTGVAADCNGTIVVEGIFKAIGILRVRPDWQVAVTFGKHLSQRQKAELLHRAAGKPLILAWDRDGIVEAERVADGLRGHGRVGIWRTQNYDPDHILDRIGAADEFQRSEVLWWGSDLEFRKRLADRLGLSVCSP